MNLKSAIVVNEAQFPEFIHEEVYPGACRANHLRQHLLGYFWKHLCRPVLSAIARQQQQSTRQPLLAGVEKLIDQVLFDSDVPPKHVRNETVGKRMFLVEHANHLIFPNR